MSKGTLCALVASTAALAGCNTPSNNHQIDSRDPSIPAPTVKAYRSGLQNKPDVYAPAREYSTPHSGIEIALGKDKGENRQFEFRGIVINGEVHDYGKNQFPENDELGFVLKPDSREKIVFIEGDPRTARSEIGEVYVFTRVMNADGKPARELWYSDADPEHPIKAIFKRPNLTQRELDILYENNTNIIMPDFEAIQINERWFLAPRAGDNDKTRSPYYLVPTEGLETGAQREGTSETGKVFVRTAKGIYRGIRMTSEEYGRREEAYKKRLEEEAKKAEQAQSPDSGIIDLVK